MANLSTMARNALKAAVGGARPAAEIFNILDNVSSLTAEQAYLLNTSLPGVPESGVCVIIDNDFLIGQLFSLSCLSLIHTPQTVAATADGTGTGVIQGPNDIFLALLQFVSVTNDDANHIVTLPKNTGQGTIILLANGATGYELRSSTPATMPINGGSEADAESAIAANSLVICICTTQVIEDVQGAWQAFSITGTTLSAVEAAAAA